MPLLIFCVCANRQLEILLSRKFQSTRTLMHGLLTTIEVNCMNGHQDNGITCIKGIEVATHTHTHTHTHTQGWTVQLSVQEKNLSYKMPLPQNRYIYTCATLVTSRLVPGLSSHCKFFHCFLYSLFLRSALINNTYMPFAGIRLA